MYNAAANQIVKRVLVVSPLQENSAASARSRVRHVAVVLSVYAYVGKTSFFFHFYPSDVLQKKQFEVQSVHI